MNRLQGVKESNGVLTEYEFDSFGNISREYTLTPNGIKTTQYEYDGNNRLLISFDDKSSTRYSYDKNGNLTSKIYELSGRETESWYSYDGYNRLSEYISGNTTAEYLYNPEGLRESKTVNGKYTRFIYDGANIVGELTNDNYYIYYRGTELLGMNSYDNRSYYYRLDSHGNVTDLLTHTGDEIKSYTYNPYGKEKPFTINPAGNETILYHWKNETENTHNPFRYCGEYQDLCSGLIYLRNRYYDPSIGRFITEDPARDGLNWYVYCRNNPIRYIDPTGYITEEEQKMYESGKMAPMAYSHLMNLTYQWYLSDDEASKAKYHQWAEDFRANDYKTTNGAFPNVDAGIEYMPSAPTDSITKEQHFFRNELNLQFSWSTFETLNDRLPDKLKWKELPFEQSAFHKFGQVNNRKYVSACEHFEVVYTKENYLVDESFSAVNMGSYNYYGPAQAQKHTDIDVSPWGKWGNTPKGWIWSDWIN